MENNIKIIIDYPDYTINDSGVICSHKNKIPLLLKPIKDKYGYLYVNLTNNGKQKKLKIHRLIALSFLTNPKNKTQINHINGVKSDNRLDNLEWVTPQENMTHAKITGLKNDSGINNPNVRLSPEKVSKIKIRLKKGQTQTSIAKLYNVHQTTISHINVNRNWKGDIK